MFTTPTVNTFINIVVFMVLERLYFPRKIKVFMKINIYKKIDNKDTEIEDYIFYISEGCYSYTVVARFVDGKFCITDFNNERETCLEDEYIYVHEKSAG